MERVEPESLGCGLKMPIRSLVFRYWIFSFAGLVPTVTVYGETVNLVIVAGQSNALGYGAAADELPPELYTPQADIRFWFEEGSNIAILDPALRISSGDAWIPLQFQVDASGSTFLDDSGGFGPEVSLGRHLADVLPNDIALLKFAFNGASLVGPWNPDGGATSLYVQMLNRLNSAITDLVNEGHTVEVVGFFWMQGESDALNEDAANAYQENLTNFIARLRADVDVADLPFVFGRIQPFLPSPGVEAVRLAQLAVDLGVPDTWMINTDDLPVAEDLLHFSAAGELIFGDRMAEAYLTDRCDGDIACVAECLRGPSGEGIAVPVMCITLFDADGDNDVDLIDYASLQPRAE